MRSKSVAPEAEALKHAPTQPADGPRPLGQPVRRRTGKRRTDPYQAGLGKTMGFAPARSLGDTPTNWPFCHWPTPHCRPRTWSFRSTGPTMVGHGPALAIVSRTFLRLSVPAFSIA